jgi:hypothetical protein
MAQANFIPGHKRSESDVTVKQSEKTADAGSRTRTYSERLHVEDGFKPARRKNSDVVDSIGDQIFGVHGVETKATTVEDAVGGNQRPTTLDMKPMIKSEQTQKQEAWRSTYRSSKEETDATPCTPPESTSNMNTDSR